jgi:hypothetical protein
MGLLGGIDLPFGGGNEDNNDPLKGEKQKTGSDDGPLGIGIGDLLGGGDWLSGNDSVGGVPSDPIGIGQYADKGLDWLNDASVDKYVGGAAGAVAAGAFTGGAGTELGWQIGSAAGNEGGDIAADVNLFSDGDVTA